MEMNTKNLMVSFIAIAMTLFLVATVSATTDFSSVDVKVDGINVWEDPAIIAGETVTIKVYFDADINAQDIRVKVEIEGDKVDVDTMTSSFDVEDGNRYKKVLNLKVPYELKDQLSDYVALNLKIWGGESEKYTDSFDLRVQRPSYNVDIKSVTMPKTVNAGETFPVDIVLKNIGYNDLDDLYVTAGISALDIEKTSYFGDLVAIECDDDYDSEENYGVDIDRKCNEDDEDTAIGRLFLKVPYDVEPGVYTFEVEVTNEDATSIMVKQMVIENDIVETVIKSGNDLIIVNPTNQVKVYKVIAESPASVSESVVVVPAGSSRTVAVSPNADEYDFNVNVFSGEKLVSTINFTGTGESVIRSPIIVLTVVLAIIFLVLLIVLVVLIGKKPEKTEEFGESYY